MSWLILIQIGWGSIPTALLVIALGAWLTGGLHLDGLMDTADGLGAGRERCLEAMEDSRIGASGVQALIIVLLIQISSIIKLGSFAPIAFPIATFWGRCSPLWAINNFIYLREDGSGYFHQKNWSGVKEAIPALIIFLATFIYLQLSSIGIISKQSLMIIIGAFPAFITPQLIGKKLGGHTGDSYGASLVIAETVTLFLLAFICQID